MHRAKSSRWFFRFSDCSAVTTIGDNVVLICFASAVRVQKRLLSAVRLGLAWSLLCAATPAFAAITYVQGNFAFGSGFLTSVTTTYTSAQSAGNLNVVVVGWNDINSHAISVTDSRGHTYVAAVGPT